MRSYERIFFPACLAVFAAIILFLLPARLLAPIGGDALSYNNGAISILTKHMYSQDFITPFYDREPGMSIFIAAVYTIFGIGNIAAVFVVQAVLYVAALLFFLSECSRLVTRRVLSIFWVLALFFPPAYYIILSLNRELLSFVLLLSAATCLLSYRRTHAIRPMIGGGLLLGLLSLFYSPYLFLPVFLLPLLLIWRTRFTHIAIFFALWLLVLFPWGLRNTLEVGRPCITGCYRSAVTWYVRGEQAEYIRGLTPLRCLWAEYISRDWSVVPPQCSFNAVMHAHWPKGLPLSDEDRVSGIAGQQKILANLPSYLSYSVFEILELHVPYVNEWGRFYNIFTVLGTVILYLGCLFGLRRLFTDRTFWLLLSIMVYTVLVFILTDATPRYLMPAIFCYFVVGATGFDRLFVFCERTK